MNQDISFPQENLNRINISGKVILTESMMPNSFSFRVYLQLLYLTSSSHTANIYFSITLQEKKEWQNKPFTKAQKHYFNFKSCEASKLNWCEYRVYTLVAWPDNMLWSHCRKHWNTSVPYLARYPADHSVSVRCWHISCLFQHWGSATSLFENILSTRFLSSWII